MANDDFIAMKFTDLTGLLDRMEELKRSAQRSVARKGAATGARYLRDEIKRAARNLDNIETKERIFRNIAARYAPRMSRVNGGAAYRIGVIGGAKKTDETGPGGVTYHWRFLEFGTRTSPAKPFFRPTVEAHKEKVLSLAMDAAVEELEKQLKKMRK